VSPKPVNADVLIIGASAAGLMCAIEAGKRGRHVLVLDHANKPGKKILMSGGGRCNFTNTDISADNYISRNPHFCKSALSRFTQWDFIAMVNEYRIPWHERDLGKLFCDDSARDILDMLLAECKKAGVAIRLDCKVKNIEKTANGVFETGTSQGIFQTASLIIASGGLSIPKMCASPLGYKIAGQFGLRVWPTSAGLVPFTLQPQDKERLAELSGIAVASAVNTGHINYFTDKVQAGNFFGFHGFGRQFITVDPAQGDFGGTVAFGAAWFEFPVLQLSGYFPDAGMRKCLQGFCSGFLP
jgi:predicted Rossmann fold flavoprotein